jgi:hypothetical protein
MSIPTSARAMRTAVIHPQTGADLRQRMYGEALLNLPEGQLASKARLPVA